MRKPRGVRGSHLTMVQPDTTLCVTLSAYPNPEVGIVEPTTRQVLMRGVFARPVLTTVVPPMTLTLSSLSLGGFPGHPPIDRPTVCTLC